MKELRLLTEWAESVMGEYDTAVTEGYDALNPVTGSMSKAEIARFRANQPIKSRGTTKSKSTGPSPEIREKLKQLRAEFAARAASKNDGINEADQPANGSTFSPLSMTTREEPRPDPRAVAKKRKDRRRLAKFMGH